MLTLIGRLCDVVAELSVNVATINSAVIGLVNITNNNNSITETTTTAESSLTTSVPNAPITANAVAPAAVTSDSLLLGVGIPDTNITYQPSSTSSSQATVHVAATTAPSTPEGTYQELPAMPHQAVPATPQQTVPATPQQVVPTTPQQAVPVTPHQVLAAGHPNESPNIGRHWYLVTKGLQTGVFQSWYVYKQSCFYYLLQHASCLKQGNHLTACDGSLTRRVLSCS